MATGNLPGYPANTPPLESTKDCADVGPTLRRHEQALLSLCNVVEQLVGANQDGNAEFWAMNGCRAQDDTQSVVMDESQIGVGGVIINDDTRACIEPFDPLPTLKEGCKAMLCGTLCVQAKNIEVPNAGMRLFPSMQGLWDDGGIGEFTAGIEPLFGTSLVTQGYFIPPRFTEREQGDQTVQVLDRSKRDGPIQCREFKDFILSTDSLQNRVGQTLFDVVPQLCFFGSWLTKPSDDDWTVEFTFTNLRLQVFCPVDFSTIPV